MDFLTSIINEVAVMPSVTGVLDTAILLDRLKQATVIRTQNVCDYLYQETEQEYFVLNRDFPNIAPPWPLFFMHHRMPRRSHSEGRIVQTAYGNVDLGFLFQSYRPEKSHWRVACAIFARGSGGTFVQSVAWQVANDGRFLNADGTEIDLGEGGCKFVVTDAYRLPSGRASNRDPSFDVNLLFVPFLALSFCHCKNVAVRRETVPLPVQHKRQRKYGWSPQSWHEIQIEPVRRVLENSGARQGRNGLARALHIQRGSFRDYREGRGLFGKHHGIWWWEAWLKDASHPHGYTVKPSATADLKEQP